MKIAMKNKVTSIRSNAGQAVVEYILVLVVVVGLILGALYQLNTAFQVWANSYFGEYLVCLMETGELPTLGQPNPTSECRELYRSFTLEQGDPLVGERIGANGNSGGRSGDGSNSGNAAAAPSGNADNSFIARNRSSANRNGTASRFRSRGGGADEDDEDGISREGSTSGGTVTGGFSNEEGGPQRFAVRRGGKRGKRGTQLDEKEETEKRTKAKNVEKGPEQKSGPQLIKIVRTPDQQTQESDLEDVGFGGFLRYLIIAAILIAVVLFLGGQILQVSKSMQ